jgi:murein DD-endopeptidase MepM/ murein hydrolase activator NlpD
MKVKIGDRVKIGQVIGRSGRSGKVSGPLLHWMVVNGRVKVDPLSLLQIKL